MRYELHGSGPHLFVGYPLRASGEGVDNNPETATLRNSYLAQLSSRYRVILMDYPPTGEKAEAVIESFTPARVCADILSVADAVGADRFAWYGYSWGGVVGIQLAASSNRLTALVCGGWPPLGAPYRDMVSWSERVAERTGLPDWKMTVTYYRGLLTWAGREAISTICCPRMAFAGTDDVIVSGNHVSRWAVAREASSRAGGNGLDRATGRGASSRSIHAP